MSAAPCPHCEAPLGADGICARCLLETGFGADGQTAAERLFQAALSYEEKERAAFLEKAAADDRALLEEVEMLMEGYAEAGGDAAAPTLGGAANARSQWAAAAREEPGAMIEHFRLVRLIGAGGMGTVWEAEQTAPIRRRVALKVIKLGMDTEEVVRRFERERRALALMTHPHIAQVFEAGATPLGRPYFAMELVEGEPITAHCSAHALGVRKRLALFLEACAAVEHAHQKGVIHRDLKPSNLLVGPGGVKVIDFGVAKATQDDGAGDGLYTRQAQVLGTPAYMSPEQAETEGVDVDTRTDVYSLGVVLYEMLSGALPFDPKRLASTGIREVQRILREEVPPLPSTRVGTAGLPLGNSVQSLRLHRDLDWIVMKALSKERARRYSSVAAFAEDVRRFLQGRTVRAAPLTASYRFGKFVRRHHVAVVATTAVAAALVAGLVISLLQMNRANRALAGEAKARDEATFTLSDMYARSGFAAAENGDPTRAALWFANAAIIGAKDPNRAATNRLRAETWRREAPTAVLAFDTGYEHLNSLQWNPRRAAMIVQSENVLEAQVWDLATEQRWQPERKLARGAWSANGDLLVVSLPTHEIAVLEFPSGNGLAHLDHVTTVAVTWSPDDQLIAAENVLWDWRKNERRALPVPATRLRFSRDGRLLLLQWNDLAGICAVSEPGKFLHEPVASRSSDGSDFLGNGESYAVWRADGVVVVHDSTSGEVRAQYPSESPGNGNGQLLAASGDGRFLARRNLPILDLQSGAATFPRHKAPSGAAQFSPDGTLLASGDYDNRLELWTVPGGEFVGVVGHHHSAVINLTWSPDGRFLASGEDGLVRVWNTERAEPVRRIPAGAITLAALSEDGNLLAASGFTNAGSSLEKTRAFHLADGTPAGPEITPGGKLMDATFSRDGLWLAVATTTDRSFDAFQKSGGAGNVQLWNHATGQRVGEPISLPSEPRGLCLHPSGKWLGVCCAGGEGVEIDTATRELRVLFKNSKTVTAGGTLNNGRCAYSPDGRVFAVWGTFQFMHLWDRDAARDLIEPFTRESNTFDLAFQGDTAARAIVAPRMTLDFRSLRTGAETAPAIPYTNWPFLTRFSEDGALLLTAGGGKTAQVWDWRAGKLICPTLPHEDAIMAGCFVPGTPWVITGGHDGNIKFWDRRTGMMIRPPLKRSGWVLHLQLTPDAKTLIACGNLDGNIELMNLADLLPAVELDATSLLLRAEIDADATVHPGGGLAPLTPQGWMEKWRRLRQREPHGAAAFFSSSPQTLR